MLSSSQSPPSPCGSTLSSDTRSTAYVTTATSTSGLWFIPAKLSLPPRNQCGPAHSRRKPAMHIPRPRNAFILFRSHFHLMHVLPNDLSFCRDHRQISRIVSFVWADLPARDKERFFHLSEEELRVHQKNYPLFVIPEKDVRQKGYKYDGSEKGTRLTPEELQCKRIAKLVLAGLRGDELTAKIRELIPAPAARKNPQSPPIKESYTIPDPPLPSVDEETIPRREQVSSARIPAPKNPRKAGKSTLPLKSKSRSSTSISKMSKSSINVSIYQRMVNPPRRHRAQISYAEYESDEGDTLVNESDTLSSCAESVATISRDDELVLRSSDSDTSVVTASHQSMETDCMYAAVQPLPGTKQADNPFVIWADEEDANNAFGCDNHGLSIDPTPTSYSTELYPERMDQEEAQLYELEQQIFAERGRTPFDLDGLPPKEDDSLEIRGIWDDYYLTFGDGNFEPTTH